MGYTLIRYEVYLNWMSKHFKNTKTVCLLVHVILTRVDPIGGRRLIYSDVSSIQ